MIKAFDRDAFLEEWLGYPVGRVRDAAALPDALADLNSYPRWMLEARAPSDRIGQAEPFTRCGFRLVDTNVQLTRVPGPLPALTKFCRFATADDEQQVRAIAAQSFSLTRFHQDRRIPNETADRIKEEWVGNFFNGRRGQWMVVAEDELGVSGFLQLLKSGEVVVIDLIAVAARARSKGVARSMIAYAAISCLGRDAELKVGTQLANSTSLRLYTKLGFQVSQATHVFHLHAEDLTR
jgi:GNAT superfamily N-acetyltransferase